ncbi:MAG: universal stress protein [Pseudomonadota bacterium]
MYKKVLVPIAVDHSPNTDTQLQIAKALAGSDGKITVLTVMEAVPSFIMSELPEGQLEHNQAEMRKVLEGIVGDPAVEIAVVMGHAGRTINQYADENGTDCIVIASHQPGLQDYFLGSTAARVVRHAHCAVHVLR